MATMSNSLHISTDLQDSSSNFFVKATKMIKKSFEPDTHIDSSPGWGVSVKKEVFRDVDSLENGYAREYISEECLSPFSHDSRWYNCYVERIDKTKYRLFEDTTDRFLLSAKQIEGTFYISQYQDFPDVDGCPSNNYCAVLKRTPGKPNFKLYNCGCEGCDKGFMKYTCNAEYNEDSGMASADRQMLADITQSVKHVKEVNADMRSLSIVLPAVMSDRKSRVVWCPRQHGSDTPKGGTPRATKKHFITSPSPTHSHIRKFDDYGIDTDRLIIRSKLPEWNEDLNSLVLRFNGGRVLAASSKNFLVTDEKDRGIVQFGKCRRGRFILDYRFPIAPIQAFAMALSSCAWTVE